MGPARIDVGVVFSTLSALLFSLAIGGAMSVVKAFVTLFEVELRSIFCQVALMVDVEDHSDARVGGM
jgi:hypothetical protein